MPCIDDILDVTPLKARVWPWYMIGKTKMLLTTHLTLMDNSQMVLYISKCPFVPLPKKPLHLFEEQCLKSELAAVKPLYCVSKAFLFFFFLNHIKGYFSYVFLGSVEGTKQFGSEILYKIRKLALSHYYMFYVGHLYVLSLNYYFCDEVLYVPYFSSQLLSPHWSTSNNSIIF